MGTVEKWQVFFYTASTMEMIPQQPACLKGGRSYEQKGRVWIGWAAEMGELAKDEAHHHDEDTEDAREVHQLNCPRNAYYHTLIQSYIKTLPQGSSVLEIAAGSGYDAQALKDAYQLTLSDVSVETLNRLADNLSDDGIIYVAADGEHLPFVDHYFDGAYMVAVLHHFEHPEQGLKECARVLKPSGVLVIGMEPNTFYFKWIHRFQGMLYRLTHTDPSYISKADAETKGFSYAELKALLNTGDWQDVKIRPAWFLAGWWHYAAEFLFRALKFKKRLVLPLALEKLIVTFDEILFKLPFVKHLGWHWIIVAKRKL